MSAPTLIPLINFNGHEVYYPLYSLKSLEIYQTPNKKFRVRAVVHDENPIYKEGERILLLHQPQQEMPHQEARTLLENYIHEYTTDLSHDMMAKIENLENQITELSRRLFPPNNDTDKSTNKRQRTD